MDYVGAEESLNKQKSREQYINLGDGNTTFFLGRCKLGKQ